MSGQYNYTAFYEDGTTINKSPNDVSFVDQTKSGFFDVLERSKNVKLISFVLYNNDLTWGVDLRDGHFELNGIPFFQHKAQDQNVEDFRLIFYQTSQRHFDMTSGKDLGGGVLCYTLGWQGLLDGKNTQRVIVIPNNTKE